MIYVLLIMSTLFCVCRSRTSPECRNHLYVDNHGLGEVNSHYYGNFSVESIISTANTVNCLAQPGVQDNDCDITLPGTSQYELSCSAIDYHSCRASVIVSNATSDAYAKLSASYCIPASCKDVSDFHSLQGLHARDAACPLYWTMGLECYVQLDCGTDPLSNAAMVLIAFSVSIPILVGTLYVYLAKDPQYYSGPLGLDLPEALIGQEEKGEKLTASLSATTYADLQKKRQNREQITDNTDSSDANAGSFACWKARVLDAWNVKDATSAIWERHPNSVTMLDGMRALAVLWVLSFHNLLFWDNFRDSLGSSNSPEDRQKLRALRNTPLMAFVRHGDLGVDIFFVLSGFLIAAMLQKEMARNNGKIRYFRFLRRRLVRIIPAYALAFALTLWRGWLPNNNCSETWYTNMLFINNFKVTGEQSACMGHLWSVAVEIQMYILTPLFVYGMNSVDWHDRRYLKSRYRGLLLPASMGVFGVVVRMMQIFNNAQDSRNYFETTNMYHDTVERLPAYMAGLSAAFIVNEWKETPAQFKWTFGGWPKRVVDVVAYFLLFFIPYVGAYALGEKGGRWIHYGYALNIVLTGYGRTIYACVLAYFIVIVLTGSGGVILNKFLSSKFWLPFARLSYSAYLIQFLTLYRAAAYVYIGDSDTTWETTRAYAAFGWVSFSFTFSVAYLMWITVERAPLVFQSQYDGTRRLAACAVAAVANSEEKKSRVVRLGRRSDSVG